MANPVKWETPAAIITLMTTEMDSLANGANALGATEVDNFVNLDTYADFELNVDPAGTPSATAFVSLYLIVALDGTNFQDGDGAIDPPFLAWVGNFPVRDTINPQRILMRQILLPPFKFKPLVINETVTTLAASGSVLRMRTYNEEVT